MNKERLLELAGMQLDETNDPTHVDAFELLEKLDLFVSEWAEKGSYGPCVEALSQLMEDFEKEYGYTE